MEQRKSPPPPEIERLVLGYPLYRLIYPGIPAALCNIPKVCRIELNGKTNVNDEVRTSKEAEMTSAYRN